MVYLHRVTDGLECVERYAHGQDDVLDGEVFAKQGVEQVDAEVGVLEVEQRQEFHRHYERQPALAQGALALVHTARHGPAEQCGQWQEHAHLGVHPGEEVQGEEHHIEFHQRTAGTVKYGVYRQEDDKYGVEGYGVE